MMAHEILSHRQRHRSVSNFFTENANSWRDRYESETYDAYQYRKRAEIALSWLGRPLTPENRRLLDIGCGAGIQAGRAALQGWDVTAADLSLGMLELAASNVRGPQLLAASAEALPIRPRSIDAVFMLGIIMYVADVAATLQHVREVLRPGGRLIISWSSPRPPLLKWIGDGVSAVPKHVYIGLKRSLGGRIERVADRSGFYDVYSRYWLPEDFLRLLESSGYRVLEVRGHNFGVFRFVGKPLWPQSIDIRLTRMLEHSTRHGHLNSVSARARSYIALATPAPVS
jgi:ubiquinone/menaquinone biosynthesis C-methylase UbiE